MGTAVYSSFFVVQWIYITLFPHRSPPDEYTWFGKQGHFVAIWTISSNAIFQQWDKKWKIVHSCRIQIYMWQTMENLERHQMYQKQLILKNKWMLEKWLQLLSFNLVVCFLVLEFVWTLFLLPVWGLHIVSPLLSEPDISTDSAQCTVYSTKFKVQSVKWKMHSAQYTEPNAQCTVDSAQGKIDSTQCTVHSAKCTVHSGQCTVHSAHCTLHSA